MGRGFAEFQPELCASAFAGLIPHLATVAFCDAADNRQTCTGSFNVPAHRTLKEIENSLGVFH